MKQTLIAIALLITSISYGQSNPFKTQAYQYINSLDTNEVSAKFIDPATIIFLENAYRFLNERKVFEKIFSFYKKPECEIGAEMLDDCFNMMIEDMGIDDSVLDGLSINKKIDKMKELLWKERINEMFIKRGLEPIVIE